MRLASNLLQKVKFFRMESLKSDYIGTKKKVVETGVFRVQVDYSRSFKQTEKGFEDDSLMKLIIPDGCDIRQGDMFAIDADHPEYLITKIHQWHGYRTAEAKSWK